MQYARSAAAVFDVVAENRETSGVRAARFTLALIFARSGRNEFSLRDVVVREKETGVERLRRRVRYESEFIIGEMRHDLPRRTPEDYLEKWSESEFFAED